MVFDKEWVDLDRTSSIKSNFKLMGMVGKNDPTMDS